jgi:hypothetical protein
VTFNFLCGSLIARLISGQRRADLVDPVELGPVKVSLIDGIEWLTFRQIKNRAKKPVHLEIPLMPELRHIIEPTGNVRNGIGPDNFPIY